MESPGSDLHSSHLFLSVNHVGSRFANGHLTYASPIPEGQGRETVGSVHETSAVPVWIADLSCSVTIGLRTWCLFLLFRYLYFWNRR